MNLGLMEVPFIQIKTVVMTSLSPNEIQLNSDLIVTDTTNIASKQDVYSLLNSRRPQNQLYTYKDRSFMYNNQSLFGYKSS
jgi:hypothetical protein